MAQVAQSPHRASIVEGGVVYKNLNEFVKEDGKIFFAATDRNKEAILEQLRPYLANSVQVLEVGSGSGQHIYHFAKEYPNVVFQPTECDTSLFASIEAYMADFRADGHNAQIKAPIELDATNAAHWAQVERAGRVGKDKYDLVLTTNVFHITPWIVGQSIVRGAGRVLQAGGFFVLYGAFKRHGKFNAKSNAQFDQTLRGRDASWGVREINDIVAVAQNEASLQLKEVLDMPSNNYMLIFQKVDLGA
ncbi:hypothetical protein BGZ52_005332 [Haplosporangium bisporale]|nr:hypothetical protein BGZ52_005332 [Haplosporangium bisporale]KAF9207506.1 hypothetical protein BGZ59_011113 [Podila verticillata]KFH64570.1 hypothetical protein MVEG_09303 [Podila verticillata NRRL 6337]